MVLGNPTATENKTAARPSTHIVITLSLYPSPLLLCVDLKKKKKEQCKSCELSFWGHLNEDYSLGNSILDSPKKLLWRGGGNVSIYLSLVRKLHVIKHTFLQKAAASLIKVTASHKEQTSPFIILLLIWTWRTVRIGLIKSSENIYLKSYSADFSQNTECLTPEHSEFVSGCIAGWKLQELMI